MKPWLDIAVHKVNDKVFSICEWNYMDPFKKKHNQDKQTLF